MPVPGAVLSLWPGGLAARAEQKGFDAVHGIHFSGHLPPTTELSDRFVSTAKPLNSITKISL